MKLVQQVLAAAFLVTAGPTIAPHVLEAINKSNKSRKAAEDVRAMLEQYEALEDSKDS